MAIKPEDLLGELKWMRNRIDEARKYLDFEKLRAQIELLEAESSRPGFWDDATAAQDQVRKLNLLKGRLDPWVKLERDVGDTLELAELAEDDPAMEADLLAEVNRLSETLDSLETRALMSEPTDTNPAYLYIHAGAGGTESCDWAQMLLRMYSRWCERHSMKVTTIELIDGEEAGIRSATLLIEGDYAYGQLKSESGIHRLVRISPFDANKRRHTSFCSVYAWPQVDDAIEVDIKDDDIKIDTFRASGAGGQHVNKTSSAIRITHLPTKLVVQCQNERSQHQNKATALKMLRSRLFQYYMDQRQVEADEKESQKKDISWGNQIRSYVFQPYQLVKDHRTGQETGNIIAVMDGDFDRFTEAYLRWSAGMPQPGKEGGGEKSLDLPE